MSKTRFYTLALDGRKFFGEVSSDGPVIVDDCAGWVPIGLCSIVKLLDPAFKRVMLPGGGHEDSLIDPVPRWWIVKYSTEMRIKIDDLSDTSRHQLSAAFGIPIRDFGIGEWDFGKRFAESAAGAGLREWATMHPRLLKRYFPSLGNEATV